MASILDKIKIFFQFLPLLLLVYQIQHPTNGCRGKEDGKCD